MAEPAQGYLGPDDPSCYNCGSRGHWAVACPEPTRRTPAGLAKANALRNSPNTPQGNVQHSHRGPKRSNKGPIITKYAPPPPPPSLPHPSIGHGAPPYPPPAGPAYQQPSPQFQNSYPLHPPPIHPPPIHYSASYGPPTYLPPQYPPSSYGAPPAAPVGYAAHPPVPPAPPPASYPPSYGSYPPHIGPAGSPGYPPPAAYPPSYPQPPYGPAPVHYPPRGAPVHHHPPPAATPPKPPRSSHTHSSLKEPTNASLPPKPPKSIHTQQEPQRDHRNKRKHDRQNNKHRDNRRKDQGGRRRSQQKTQNKANHSGSAAAGSSRKAPAPAKTNGPKDPNLSSASGLAKNARAESEASTITVEMLPSNNIEESHQDDEQSLESHARELDEESVVADEHFENHTGDESENTAQGLVTKTGAIAAGDNESFSQNPQDSGYDNISTPSSHQSDKPRINGKHKRLDDESGDEKRPKKAKSSDSLTDGQNGAKEGSREETHNDARQAQGNNSPPERDEEDNQALPELESRSRSRSRSRERYQKHGSKSRNSSVSSRSSDLNSLEAELLGRPDKRSSAEPSPRQRRDSLTIPKMQRRRQANADSAYSRRW